MNLNKKYLTFISLFTLTTGVSLRMGSLLGGASTFNVAGAGSSSSYTPVYDMVTFTVSHSDGSWLTGQDRTRFSERSIETYASNLAKNSSDKTQFFVWQSAYSRLNTTTGTFIALDSDPLNAWNVLEASGKLTNRVDSENQPISSRPSNAFYLTGITMVVAKRTPNQSDIDTPNPVTIELEKTDVTKESVPFVNEETGENDYIDTYTVDSLNPVKKWPLTPNGADTGSSYVPTVRLLGETTLASNTITLTQTFEYSDQISTYRILSSHQTYFQSITFEYSIDYGDC